jgi:alpha-N-arabinofuranosidase
MRDALVASVHFDAFHRHADRLVMANIAQTVNVLQSVLLTDPETDELILTPTYHVFEMNRAHHDARSLDVRMHGVGRRTLEDGSELDLLSLSASTKDDEALISLSNLDATHSHEVMLDLRGRRVAGSAARLLTGDTVQAHNTAASPDAVGVRSHPIQEVANDFGHGIRIELPPHSYATVSLQLT